MVVIDTDTNELSIKVNHNLINIALRMSSLGLTSFAIRIKLNVLDSARLYLNWSHVVVSDIYQSLLIRKLLIFLNSYQSMMLIYYILTKTCKTRYFIIYLSVEKTSSLIEGL